MKQTVWRAQGKLTSDLGVICLTKIEHAPLHVGESFQCHRNNE